MEVDEDGGEVDEDGVEVDEDGMEVDEDGVEVNGVEDEDNIEMRDTMLLIIIIIINKKIYINKIMFEFVVCCISCKRPMR